MKGAKILKKGQQFESKGPFFKSVFFCTQITAEVFVCLFEDFIVVYQQK